MRPSSFYAPGLTGASARLLARRPHVAVFDGKDVCGCSCGKSMDESGYKLHLKGRTG